MAAKTLLNKIILSAILAFVFQIANSQDVNKQLLKAAKNYDFKLFKKSISDGADINTTNHKGETALHLTAYRGHIGMLEYLLENKANTNLIDQKGQTPLFQALSLWEGQKIIYLLLKNGANINIQDTAGNTVLHKAASKYDKSQSWELTQLFLYFNANKEIKNNKNLKAFDLAVKRANKRVSALLKSGKPDIYFLAKYGNFEEIQDYFLNNNVEINKPDEFGKTILSYAIEAFNDRDDIVEYLLSQGADVNYSEWDVLDIAIENNHHRIIEKVLKKYNKKAGYRPVRQAIRSSNLKIIKLIIDQADKKELEETGPELLLEACKYNNIEAVKYLISKKVDVNYKDYDGKTPLHYACIGSYYDEAPINKDIIGILINAGAKVNETDENKNTPLIYTAMYNKEKAQFKYLIENGADIKAVNENGENILTFDCLYNQSNIDLLQDVINKGANTKQETSNKETPLCFAIKANNLDAIELLLKNGAEKPSSKHINLAVLGRSMDALKLLSQNSADFKDVNTNLAIIPDTTSFIEFLLKKGVNPNFKDNKNMQPLHFASKIKNNYKTIDLLLKSGANINAQSGYFNQQLAPIDIAIKENNNDNLKLLHTRGANLNTNNALKLAVIHKNDLALELLLENKYDVNTKDSDNKTALHYAAQIPNSAKVIKLLVNSKSEINAVDSKGHTPLDIAIKNNCSNNIKELIANGANIHTNEALTLAVNNKDIKLIELLISKGYDLNHMDKIGRTALHYAVMDTSKELNTKIIELLIKNGAKVKLSDRDFETPLHIANRLNRKDVFTLLKNQYQKEFSSVSSKNALLQNELILQEKIAIDTSHFEGSSSNYDTEFIKSLYFKSKAQNNIDFSYLLLKKLTDNSVQKYIDYSPYNFIPLSEIPIKEIKERLGNTTDEILVEDPETGDFKAVLIETEAYKNELNGILFNDSWDFDELNFKFKKEVKAYCPIRSYLTEEGEYYRHKKTAYFVFDNYKSKKHQQEIEQRMQLFRKVRYEFYFESTDHYALKEKNGNLSHLHIEKENSPFWTSYAINKLRNIIIDRVLTGQSDAYDFETGQKINAGKIPERLGMRTEIVMVEDIETGEFIEKQLVLPLNINEIKSVIFIENWYIDETSMRIKKEIVGVAPVLWTYAWNDIEDELRKKIAFVVYFDNYKPDELSTVEINESIPLDSVGLHPKRDIFNNHSYYSFKNTGIKFKDLVINKIKNNKGLFYELVNYESDYAAYQSNSYKKLEHSQLLKNIGIQNDTVIIEDFDGSLKESIVPRKPFGTDSICAIHSYEIWKFDPKKFTFQKNVFSYAPAIKFYRKNDPERALYKKIAYVKNSTNTKQFIQKPDSRMKLFKQIRYEHGFDPERMLKTAIPESEKQEPLFWSNYHQKKFKELIFETISNNTKPIYNFEGTKKLSKSEIESSMTIGTIELIEPETGELYTENLKLDYNDLKSIIFAENWYINEQTLQIHKEVVGVAPVFYTKSAISEQEEKIEKHMPFFIYFEKN